MLNYPFKNQMYSHRACPVGKYICATSSFYSTDEDNEQELTYADVRIVQRQVRREPQKEEAGVEYGEVKISGRPRERAQPPGDDCVYSMVRRDRWSWVLFQRLHLWGQTEQVFHLDRKKIYKPPAHIVKTTTTSTTTTILIYMLHHWTRPWLVFVEFFLCVFIFFLMNNFFQFPECFAVSLFLFHMFCFLSFTCF